MSSFVNFEHIFRPFLVFLFLFLVSATIVLTFYSRLFNFMTTRHMKDTFSFFVQFSQFHTFRKFMSIDTQNYFNPYFSNVLFWSSCKLRKYFSFLTFSRGSKRNIGKKRVKNNQTKTDTWWFLYFRYMNSFSDSHGKSCIFFTLWFQEHQLTCFPHPDYLFWVIFHLPTSSPRLILGPIYKQIYTLFKVSFEKIK